MEEVLLSLVKERREGVEVPRGRRRPSKCSGVLADVKKVNMCVCVCTCSGTCVWGCGCGSIKKRGGRSFCRVTKDLTGRSREEGKERGRERHPESGGSEVTLTRTVPVATGGRLFELTG